MLVQFGEDRVLQLDPGALLQTVKDLVVVVLPEVLQAQSDRLLLPILKRKK